MRTKIQGSDGWPSSSISAATTLASAAASSSSATASSRQNTMLVTPRAAWLRASLASRWRVPGA